LVTSGVQRAKVFLHWAACQHLVGYNTMCEDEQPSCLGRAVSGEEEDLANFFVGSKFRNQIITTLSGSEPPPMVQGIHQGTAQSSIPFVSAPSRSAIWPRINRRWSWTRRLWIACTTVMGAIGYTVAFCFTYVYLNLLTDYEKGIFPHIILAA